MSVKKEFAVAARDPVENVGQFIGRGDARRVCLIHEEHAMLFRTVARACR